MAGPFELKLNAFAEKAGDRANAAVRQAILEFSRRVKIRTPVDTGRLRNSWRFDASMSGGLDVGDVADGASAAATDTAPGLPPDVLGGIVYLYNPMPYAWRVEAGFSGPDSLGRKYNQAPVGMVALAEIEFRGIVDDAARSVNQ